MLILELLSESQTKLMLDRRRVLVSARKALLSGDLDQAINDMQQLLTMGFPREGAAAFFERNHKLIKPLVMAAVRRNNDPTYAYNVAADIMNMWIDWPWLQKVKQDAAALLKIT